MSRNLLATPFTMIPMWVIQAVSPRAVVVYGVLRFRAGNKDAAWPTMETIGADAGCSADAARRAVRELEAAGALVVEYRDGDSSLYRLADQPPAKTPPLAKTRGTPGKNAGGTPGKNAGENYIQENQIQELDTGLPPQSVGDPDETVSVVPSSGDALPARTRPRDNLFEAVATVCYGGWDRLTSTERSLANKACKELRAVGATPEDVVARAEAYVRWRGDIDAIPTPPTLVKYWSRLASPVQRIPRHEIDALAEEQFMGLRMAEAERRERERLADEAARSTVTSDRQLGDGHPPPTWLSDQYPREDGESVRDYIRRLNAMTKEAG